MLSATAPCRYISQITSDPTAELPIMQDHVHIPTNTWVRRVCLLGRQPWGRE